ncbi:MAG: MFS transporter [Anaerolineae bacterium]
MSQTGRTGQAGRTGHTGWAGLQTNVVALGLVSLFQDISSEMIYPLLPLFLANVLGADKVIIGLIEGIAESTASLLKVFSGWLSDRSGRRKAWAVGGYSLSALVKPIIALATAWPFVLVVRFLDRVGKGVRTAPRDALLAASSPAESRGRSFGLHRAMDTAGAVAGPLLAYALLPVFSGNYRPIFALTLIPGLISVALLIFLVRERRVEASPAQRQGLKLSLAPFDRPFRLFLLAVLVFTLGNSSDAFLLLRANATGVPGVQIPLLWLVFNVVNALASTPAGALSDRMGRRGVIISGYGVFALVYLGFAGANTAWQIWLLFAAYGLYYGLTDGVQRAYAADLVPAHLRGTAFGIYHTLTGLALFPASLVAGWLWQTVGVPAPFFYGAAMSGLAVAIFVFALRR